MNDLNRLFYWHGIAEDYFNYKGDLVKVSLENRKTLLRTMGVNVDSKPALVKAAFSVDVAPWLRWLPRLLTHPQHEPASFYLHLKPQELVKEYSWCLFRGDNEVGKGVFKPAEAQETGNYQFQNTRYTRRNIPLGNMVLEPGYYKLEVCSESRKEVCYIAIIPPESWQPDWAREREKLWGVIVQLYTLRSESDWGIGDFGDLKRLIRASVQYGIDVIGLNPLHTLLPDLEHNCSPYSPSDRRFLNPLYIDIENTPDFIDAKLVNLSLKEKAFASKIAQLRDANHVDYVGVKNLKYSFFQRMYSHFRDHILPLKDSRAIYFEDFIQKGGSALQAIGLYEAMYNRWLDAEFIVEPDEDIWTLPDSKKQIEIRVAANRDAVHFHIYLQWLCELQLQECQDFALESGMKLGLVRDLAVGANGSGCEVKSNSTLFCLGASVGAPPDPFSDLGQNWGIPPMDPAELRESGFKHYIDLLRANMTSCGALRIDHAMSLLRLWWCPPDETADHGAYVYYPFEDLLGLLKLESHLNKCVIIGEDLGVVPPEFRENMSKAKVFANKVFYFEKEHFHFFKPPQAYDEHALAMVNNHDVPTLKSWWDGTDLKLRDELQLFEEGVDYPQMCINRQQEKEQACKLLRDQGLFPAAWEGRQLEEEADKDIIYAILKLNSRVKSQIFVIQLEDLLLMNTPTNVPGTFKEYPNWQRKIVRSIDDIFGDSGVQRVLKDIQRERHNE